MGKLEFQNFDLKKVKLSKTGLDFRYFEKGQSGNEIEVKAEGLPHPDLMGVIESLQLYMALRLDLLKGWDFSRDKLKGDLDLLAEAMKGYEAEIKRCEVTGLSWVGADQLLAVKITGKLNCTVGSLGMATPNITFSSEKLGYESEVEELSEALRKETYLYYFKNKRAQQDLLSQADEALEAAKLAGYVEKNQQ